MYQIKYQLSTFRDVFLEKHWRSVIPRSVCDYYLEAQRASPNVSIVFEYL